MVGKLAELAIVVSLITLSQRLTGYENKPLGYFLLILAALGTIHWLWVSFGDFVAGTGLVSKKPAKIGPIRTILTTISAVILVGFVAWPWLSLSMPTPKPAPIPASAPQPKNSPEPIRDEESITTALTIDRAKPFIRQFRYSIDDGQRMSVETTAAQWIVDHDKNVFNLDRSKLTRDLVIFSLIGFLRSNEGQLWEIHPHRIGSVITFHEDPGRTCTLVADSDIRASLRDSGNIFAFTPIFTRQPVCLPPASHFTATSDSINLRGKGYELYFILDREVGVNFMNPGAGEQLPRLPNGEMRYETRSEGVDVMATYFPDELSDVGKYREWGSRLVKAAKRWFEQ